MEKTADATATTKATRFVPHRAKTAAKRRQNPHTPTAAPAVHCYTDLKHTHTCAWMMDGGMNDEWGWVHEREGGRQGAWTERAARELSI
eukprot:scaffold14708_cov108-Isochrysis_galbana.AAC.2